MVESSYRTGLGAKYAAIIVCYRVKMIWKWAGVPPTIRLYMPPPPPIYNVYSAKMSESVDIYHAISFIFRVFTTKQAAWQQCKENHMAVDRTLDGCHCVVFDNVTESHRLHRNTKIRWSECLLSSCPSRAACIWRQLKAHWAEHRPKCWLRLEQTCSWKSPILLGVSTEARITQLY